MEESVIIIDEVYSDDSSECSDYYIIDELSDDDTFYVIEKNNKTYLCDTEYEFNLLRAKFKLD